MTTKTMRRIIGAIVFLFSAVILFMTVQPSVSFWDPGEIASASYSLMVPHPPGGPLWLIIGRVFSMLPIANDIGFRINTVSVLAAAFSILLLYLIAIKLIESYRGKENSNKIEAAYTYISAAIGALAMNFCDTFWFNAAEANYFALSTLLFALIVWLMMIWYEKSDSFGSEKYIMLMAYLIGLSVGVHLMSVLAILTFIGVVVMKKYVTDDEAYKKSAYIFVGHIAVMILIAMGLWASQTGTTPPSVKEFKAFDSRFVWIMIGVSAIFMGAFWRKIFHRNSFYLPWAVGAVALFMAYPGVVKEFPALLLALGGAGIVTNMLLFLLILAVLLYLIRWTTKNKKEILHYASLGLLFMLLGFTTYSMIIIRANQNPPMNENSPNNFHKLMYYLDREQYGDFPIFKRRFSQQDDQQGIYTNYSSDLDFMWRYQVNHMFNRYFLWNFVGRKSTVQDAGIKWNQLYAIPFLIGLLGFYFHFRKDWKMASAWLILFVFMGYLIMFYQNQQQPQPRERFYFYPGALFVFAVWISVGIRELADRAGKLYKKTNLSRTAGFTVLALGLFFIPGNMLRTDYFTHDRSNNWLPWDFAYNLLQSCKPNAILFTNGDNDTFPLWFLQDVEGVRRDIRVVCLSLANTSWYVEQLKHQSPYGALKVNFSMSDQQIDRLEPVQWDPQTETLPVPPGVAKEFGVTDTSVINNHRISWRMNNTVQFGKVKAVRIQDLVVRDIIQSNSWTRPIYFASTCSNDCFIGLDNYLELTGLASRLVPRKSNAPEYVNANITKADLFNDIPSFSKDYHTGFKFRGLNNPGVFFNDTEMRLIQNYRNTYVRLAYYYHDVLHNDSMCVKTLDKMEDYIPRSVIPIDYRFLYDVANIYYSAGAIDKFKKMADDIIPTAEQKMSDITSQDLRSPYNSFTMLERIYVNMKEYDKAIGVLQKLEDIYPGISGVKQEIDQIKAMKRINQPDTSAAKK